VKGPGKHVEGDVAQDFGAGAIAQPDIVKANHPGASCAAFLRKIEQFRVPPTKQPIYGPATSTLDAYRKLT
jgi:hypothetical protein